MSHYQPGPEIMLIASVVKIQGYQLVVNIFVIKHPLIEVNGAQSWCGVCGARL